MQPSPVTRLAIATLTLAVFGGPTARADWPQFLGADRDGVAEEAEGLARSWPADGPKVVWRLEVTTGYACPSVHGDAVFLMENTPGRADGVRRLNLADGREVWKQEWEARNRTQYPGSRSTPATDGESVYALGTTGRLVALDFKTGRVSWTKDLMGDWQAQIPGWGVAQSPLLLGDLVIVMPWGRRAAVVAYNKKTGEVAWTTPNSSGRSMDYQSPVPMMLGDRLTILCSGRNGYTIGVDAENGRELWSYGGVKGRSFFVAWDIPSPVAVGTNHVLLTGGYGAGAALVRISGAGNGYRASEVWHNRSIGSQIAPALVHDRHFYANSFDSRGGLRCVNGSGEVVWDSNVRMENGSILIADGLLYAVNGNTGDLLMVEASSEGYKELGRARNLLKGKEIWGYMAYSNGRLLVRDKTHLLCLDVRAD